MLPVLRRQLATTLGPRKAVPYGVQPSARITEAARPNHRQHGTLYASGSLRRRNAMPPFAALRQMHIRGFSSSSIPRSVLAVARAFRVPIAAGIVVAGGLAYANYKFEELKRKTIGWINTATTAYDIYGTATDGVDAVRSRLSGIKLPEINFEAPNVGQYFKDLFGSEGEKGKLEGKSAIPEHKQKTTGWINTATETAHDIYGTATDGVDAVRSHLSGIKLPEVNVEAPNVGKYFKDLFGLEGEKRKSDGNDESGGESSNRR